MKVLLIKDVFKLGRAGDVKKVANGYGRNYLVPQGLAVLATPGALKRSESIRTKADVNRAIINQEMSGVAEQLSDLVLVFSAKAGETGKLYGSVTPQMIADSIMEETGIEINRRQMDSQPIRMLGTHKVDIRLTVDLVPEITVVVHREGEAAVLPGEEVEEAAAEVVVDADAQVEGEAESEAEVEFDTEVEDEAEAEVDTEIEAEVEGEEETEAEAEVAVEVDTDSVEEEGEDTETEAEAA